MNVKKHFIHSFYSDILYSKWKNIFRTQNPVRIVGFRFTYSELFTKNRTNFIVKLTAGKKNVCIQIEIQLSWVRSGFFLSCSFAKASEIFK